MLCSKRKKKDRSPEEPNEFELNSIRNDLELRATLRKRLSDVSWWMRLLCQNIGTRANQEDQEVGKFLQGRCKTVRILDEETLLACAAYVDLNPIRAAIAETLETSDYTSVQRRVLSLQQSVSETTHDRNRCDSFLAALMIDEKYDSIGACANQTGERCSDKGFLSISLPDYLELLDASARQVREGKAGFTFANVAGKPNDVYEMRSLISKRRFYLKNLKPVSTN